MLIRYFFIIDWFTDLPTLLFAKSEKNKIENICFLFPSFIMFILIMDQDIKNNKIKCFGTLIQFPRSYKGAYNKTYICEITTYFAVLLL